MLKNRKINFKTNLKLIKGKPDLTPLVDVLFILLVFFMVSTSFIQVSGIQVDLKTNSNENQKKSVEKFIISIDQYSNFYINDKPFKDINKVREELVEVKSQYKPDTVILRADNKTDFGLITELMIFIKELDMNVFIATIPEENQKNKTYEEE